MGQVSVWLKLSASLDEVQIGLGASLVSAKLPTPRAPRERQTPRNVVSIWWCRHAAARRTVAPLCTLGAHVPLWRTLGDLIPPLSQACGGQMISPGGAQVTGDGMGRWCVHHQS